MNELTLKQQIAQLTEGWITKDGRKIFVGNSDAPTPEIHSEHADNEHDHDDARDFHNSRAEEEEKVGNNKLAELHRAAARAHADAVWAYHRATRESSYRGLAKNLGKGARWSSAVANGASSAGTPPEIRRRNPRSSR